MAICVVRNFREVVRKELIPDDAVVIVTDIRIAELLRTFLVSSPADEDTRDAFNYTLAGLCKAAARIQQRARGVVVEEFTEFIGEGSHGNTAIDYRR